MKRFYYTDVDQGSDRWHTLRNGKLTGSSGKATNLIKDCKSESGLSVPMLKEARRTAAELITGDNPYNFSNRFTERGHELEPLARLEYEEQTFNTVDQVGFITMGEYIGCSPDGLVGEDGMIEIKCPEQEEYLRIISGGEIDKDYINQMQWNLWVAERKWCDHVYFHPKFKKNLYVLRFGRDKPVIEKFESKSEVFINEVKKYLKFNEA